MLAYEWWKRGVENEIRIADSEGRNPRTVAKAPGKVMAWTPDQKQLLIRWTTYQLDNSVE
jgi:hypothetical protein